MVQAPKETGVPGTCVGAHVCGGGNGGGGEGGGGGGKGGGEGEGKPLQIMRMAGSEAGSTTSGVLRLV